MVVIPQVYKFKKLALSKTLEQDFANGVNFNVGIKFELTPQYNFTRMTAKNLAEVRFEFNYEVPGFLEYLIDIIFYVDYSVKSSDDEEKINQMIIQAFHNFAEVFKEKANNPKLDMNLLFPRHLLPPAKIRLVRDAILHRLRQRK